MTTHRGSKHPRAGRDVAAPVKPTLRPHPLTAAEKEWLGEWVTDPDTGATGQVWCLGDGPTAVWIAATTPHGDPNRLVPADTRSLQIAPHRHDAAVDEPLPGVAA